MFMFRVHASILLALTACFELRSQAILEDHWKAVVPEAESIEIRKAKPRVDPKAENPKATLAKAALRDRELSRLRRLLEVLEPYGDALDNVESPVMPARAPLRHRRIETGEAWMRYRTELPIILPKRTPPHYGREPQLPVHMFIIPLTPNLYDVRIHDPNGSLNPEHGLTVLLPLAPR